MTSLLIPASRRSVSFFRELVLATMLVAAPLASSSASAEEAHAVQTGNITMQGRGSVAVAPDMAVITANVVTTAKTAEDALAENSSAISKVIDAIKNQGIEAKDIQTRGFGIYPRYEQSSSSSGRQPNIIGYEIRNGVEVNVRDLAKLGGLLTLVVENGANSVDSIRFEVSDPNEKLDEARKKAVENARHKAEIFAAAAGVGLGNIMFITETSTQMPQPLMMRAESMMASAAVPIEAGETTISAEVTIRWEIDTEAGN
ncbi:SIMPL domain-containing protein [uncultured Roseibium sp.]|uniref:SIMPL domain-containing protein n=1 Tax=uncultured Roseibium sp. TaxID=1936171 RepID=UPI0026126BAB|nr:SIMPL domain-containing protein [uncultured Roseibium sp.]